MTNNAEAAAEAYNHFLQKNYDQCLASLHTLLSSSQRGDPKIQHNVAVCEYFKGGCRDTGKFLVDLDKLGHTVDSRSGMQHTASINAVKRLASENASAYRPLCLEFEGHEYVRFNEAAALFHQRQYDDSMKRLAPLLHNHNLITKLLHARVLLLMLSCVLAQCTKGDTALLQQASSLMNDLDELQPFLEQHDKEEAEAAEKNTTNRPSLRLTKHAMLLRSHFKAVQGNYQEALAALQEYREGGDDWWTVVLYLNNLGVLHINLGKPHLASLYLTRAIQTFESSRSKSNESGPSSTISLATHPSMAAVYHNNGLCHMLRGQYELAFKSFIVAIPFLHDTPSLWLRLAQCCIRQFEKTVAADQVKDQALKPTYSTPSNASIPPRQVVHLPTKDILYPSSNIPSSKGDSGDEMSLVFADKCLHNAHYLLLRRCRGKGSKKPVVRETTPAEENPPDDAEEGGPSTLDDFKDDAEEAVAPQADPDDQDGQLEENELHDVAGKDTAVALMLQAIYCNMAYVALLLKNPAVALVSSKKLLTLPNVFQEYRIVAITYAVEAYCRLNRPADALEMLQGVNLRDLLQGSTSAITASDSQRTTASDLPKPLESPVYSSISSSDRETMGKRHMVSLFTNLTVVHIMSGNFSRAQQCLDQFKCPGQPVSHLLQIYLMMAMNKKEELVRFVKKYPISPPWVG